LIFKYDPKKIKDNFYTNTFPTLFLIPERDLNITNHWPKPNNGDFGDFTDVELLVYAICNLKKTPSISIVELKNPIASDRSLVEYFGDFYFGAFDFVPKKSALIELNNSLSARHNLNYIEESLKINNPARLDKFIKAGLREEDYLKYNDLFNSSIKPIEDWVSEKSTDTQVRLATSIKSFDNFIKFNF